MNTIKIEKNSLANLINIDIMQQKIMPLAGGKQL